MFSAFHFYWFHVHVLINACLLIGLALYISYLRIQLRLPYGDGDHKSVKQAIRAHMNGVEHALLFALLVLSLCLLKIDDGAVSLLVLGFAFGRLVHAYGMLARRFNLRRLGAALTYGGEIGAVSLLARALIV